MERRTIEPRPGWQRTVEEQGLIHPLTLPKPLEADRAAGMHSAPPGRLTGGP
ncbi:hypothetical protein [Streptomyces sp. KMM 9044]|uniref:hypothetical protein n=1 Tax=Streptomyces sp. KMM 9044 TaxID=2744474 RepID=UPI0021513177|nr:hypothetical protein [Streptomyces sp. KMM 9044]WAX78367.1 hypothetical protein HUV60_012440 [Streptomyces sp. KMM 9044]